MQSATETDAIMKVILCLLAAVTTVSSQGTNCPLVFSNISPGRRSLGATPITEVNDPAVCEARCRDDPTCFAYQIDRYAGDPLCWHQKTQSALNDLYDDSSIDEYVKQFNCNTTVSGSTTLPTTATPGPNCVAFVNLYPGLQSVFAEEIPGVTDQATCESRCRMDSACVSYQINTIPTDTYCWHQKQQSQLDPNELTDQPNVTEYIKTNCTSLVSTTLPVSSSSQGPNCFVYLNLYSGLQSIFADPILGVTDQATCESRCRMDSACVSYQINTNQGETYCWHQKQQSQLDPNKMADQSNVVEYIKTACSSVSSSSTGPTLPSSSATLSRSSSTQGPNCFVYVNLYPGLQSIFATPILGVTDQATCESRCRMDSACVSYQINTNQGETYCWHQKQQSQLDPNKMADQLNVVEYIKTACSSSSSTTLAVSSSSQGSNNVYFLILYPGLQSIFATPITGVTDQATCESRCRIDPACVSYQINTNQGETYCWHQKQQSQLDPNRMADQPNVVEYIKTNCASAAECFSSTTLPPTSTTLPVSSSSQGPSCVAFAILFPGLQSIFATPISGVTDQATCESRCRMDSACVSYQINTNQGGTYCWNQKQRSELDPNRMAGQPNVVEYIKTDCFSTSSSSTSTLSSTSTTLPISQSTQGPSCVAFAILYPGLQSIFADPITGVTDQATCESRCRMDPACVSYQINTNQGETYCWHQKQRSELDPNRMAGQPNVVEYIKTDCSFSSSSSLSTTLPTTSTTLPISTTQGPSCVVFAILYPGLQSIFADPISGVTDQATCESRCRMDSACVSYQINTNQGETYCWHQKQRSELDPNRMAGQSNVVEYIKTDCSSSSTSTTLSSVSTTLPISPSQGPNCVAFTNLYPGLQSIFADPILGVTDQATCESRCRMDPGCVSYQVNTNQGETYCWHQKQRSELDPNRMAGQSNVVEYIKTNNCTSATSSSSSTTLPSTSTTLPISTSSQGPSCVAFANLYPGLQSIFADPILGVTDQATCESRCRMDPACVSYQINTNQGETYCWIQKQRSELDPNRMAGQTNVVEYIKTDCFSTSTSPPISSTSASTSASLPSTSGTQGPNCVTAFFLLYPGNPTLDADPISGVGTPADCENRCRIDPNCVSYQLDRTPSATTIFCWHQKNINAEKFERPFIEEYFKLNNCTGTFPTQTSTPTATPTSLASTTTLLSSTTTASTTPTTSTGTTTPVCDYSFAPIPNKNMPGGIQTRWATLDECKRACLDNLQCIGIDVNPASGQIYCYLIFDVVPLSDYPGVTHYDITRGANCPKYSPTSTASTPSASTTGARVCVYKKLEGANADGGSPVGRNVREDECVMLCNLNSLCKSFEFDFATKTCFTHTAYDDSQSATCCNRYILQCSSSPCTDDFLEVKGFGPASLQGYVQSGVTTLDGCKQRCLNIVNCTRFFYLADNPRDPQSHCYLYYTAYDPIGQVPGVDLYIRQRCLYDTSVTVLTTTTTPAPTPSPNSCVIDLAFVVDSSGSIRDNSYAGVDNWKLIQMFIKDIVNSSAIHYGQYLDHVAIVEFSDFASIYTDFTSASNTSLSGMLSLIDNMPYLGSETNTPEGLRLGRELFENPAYGSRPNAVHMMILLTDGRTTDRWEDRFIPEIVALNNSAAKIIRYAIGVTNNASMDELKYIALYQSAIEVVNTYDNLRQVVSKAELFINSFPCQSSITPTMLSTTQRVSTLTTTTTTTTTQSSPRSSPSSTTTTSTTTQIFPTSSSTSTTTSTSTSSSTSTTTAPTSARQLGYEGVFCAYKNSSTEGLVNTTDFSGVFANRFGLFNLTTDRFTPALRVNGFFYTEICAGIPRYKTCRLRTAGAYPTLSFDWGSSAQDDIDSGCRGGILSVAQGVSTSLSQSYPDGAVYSDSQRLTTWSMFSVTDTMRYNSSLLSVYSSSNSSSYGALPFMSPYVNPQYPEPLYNAATKVYSCKPSTAAYFFSMSVGVAAQTTASVQLSVGDNTFEMFRLSTTTTGTTTLARSVLAPCNSATALMTLTSGSVIPGTNLISFTAFPYERSSSLISVSWAGYRTSNLTIQDPVAYDLWLVQQGVTQSSNTIQITVSGFYYVYISAGVQTRSTVNLSLLRNSEPLFGLRRVATNHNGEDTIGHGIVVLLYYNDVLKVRSYSGGYSSRYGLHASFFGMLLYDL